MDSELEEANRSRISFSTLADLRVVILLVECPTWRLNGNVDSWIHAGRGVILRIPSNRRPMRAFD